MMTYKYKSVKKHAYVVTRGRVPGLYYNWPDTQKQVNGFSGALFKGYTSLKAAEEAWEDHISSLEETDELEDYELDLDDIDLMGS